jgi:hypothetical protein
MGTTYIARRERERDMAFVYEKDLFFFFGPGYLQYK